MAAKSGTNAAYFERDKQHDMHLVKKQKDDFQSTQCNSVVIGRCDPSVSPSYMLQHFERFGDVECIFMLKERYAKVTFLSSEAAQKCYEHYRGASGTKVPAADNKIIEIQFADKFKGDRTVIEIYPCNYTKPKPILFINKCGDERISALTAIECIDDTFCDSIIALRKEKPFASMEDLIKRIEYLGQEQINKIRKTISISFDDPSFLLVSRYCNGSAEPLNTDFIPSEIQRDIICVIQSYFDHMLMDENNDIFAEELSVLKLQNKFERFVVSQEPEPVHRQHYDCEPESAQWRTITNGVNPGYKYCPGVYKGARRWIPIARPSVLDRIAKRADCCVSINDPMPPQHDYCEPEWRTITNGVNSGFKYCPGVYKSNKSWKRDTSGASVYGRVAFVDDEQARRQHRLRKYYPFW